MTIGKTLYVTDRGAWRAWLHKNYDTEPEIWLITPRLATGKPRISYNDAVEEALCVGWIDSIVKSLDSESTVQRFSPRKNNTIWSQPNIERLTWLSKRKLLLPSIEKSVEHILRKKFDFPSDIIKEIKKNKTAWRYYQRCSPSYKRIRIAYIDAARSRPDEFTKRLRNFIEKTEQNKRIGHGGIDKYY